MIQIKSMRIYFALLVAVTFIVEVAAPGFAQGRKMAGIGSFTNNEKIIDVTSPENDYVKLDSNGQVIDNRKGPPKPPKTVTVYEDDIGEVGAAEPVKDGELTIVATVAVPHMKKALTKVVAYPWPMKAPVRKQPVKQLPEKDKALRNMVLSTGYFNRASLDVPYPPGGWRWQYAFQKAIELSGISVPHSILEHYGWADRMIPFIKAQTKVYNAFERERAVRFNAANQEYLDLRTEIEDAAVHRGLTPVSMRKVALKSNAVGMHFAGNLKPGKWWLLATHRVPGLKYFWLLPVEIEKNGRVVLNESNAIYVEGGW
ncbi:MAG: hypothetical protein K2X93_07945 [Candidatus Obscuribacterales bacterium]|nr:hypothetical protein [Candidatus Obscuribacterales bacterium]